MSQNIKISIITAVYNRSETISQALRSVREQSYSNIEHIVIDGGSTDGTLQHVYAHDWSAMRIVSEPDRGIYDALNKGIALATGDVVGIMHSDDFYAHNLVLEGVANAFNREDIDAVFGDIDYVSALNPSRIIRKWRTGDFSTSRLTRGWMPPHPTLFLRRSVFERNGNYDISYKISADYEAILRYFGRGEVRSTYIPEVMIKMRAGGESNKSVGRIIRKSCEDYRALRSNSVGGLGALVWKNLSKITQFLIRRESAQ